MAQRFKNGEFEEKLEKAGKTVIENWTKDGGDCCTPGISIDIVPGLLSFALNGGVCMPKFEVKNAAPLSSLPLTCCVAEVLQLHQLDGNGIRFSLAEAVIAFLQVLDS